MRPGREVRAGSAAVSARAGRRFALRRARRPGRPPSGPQVPTENPVSPIAERAPPRPA